MQESILIRLYNGEIYPAEQFVPNTQKYKEATQQFGELKERLGTELSPSMLQIFKDYQTAQLTETLEELATTFSEGFRLGAQIILEATKSSDIPLTGNITVSFYWGGNQDEDHNDME